MLVNPRALALPLILGLALSSCTATLPTETPTPTAAPVTPVPSDEITAAPIDADAMLVVRATATDATGAALTLQYQVHASQPADDVATQTLPAAMIEDCGAELTQALLLEQGWTFTRVNVSAVPEGDWVGGRIEILPGASVPLAARGILTQDAAAAVPCHAEKFFETAGKGGLAIGLAGDDTVNTGWAGLRYGFVATGNITLSDCSFEVTDAGRAIRAEWPLVADDTTCAVG